MSSNTKEASGGAPLLTRLFLSVITCGAIANSILSILSCEFFSYQALDGKPWEGLSAPFDDLAEASVGLFGYSTHIGNQLGPFGKSCISYDEWRDVSQETYFYAAQWCSMVAPGVAALALIQMVLEWCCCRLRGSYFVIRLLFVIAALLQLGSFLVFFESQYCFDAASENECRMRKGSMYSVIALGLYLILAICYISMIPYRDAAFCCGCFISTRAVAAVAEDVNDAKAEEPEADATETDDQDRGQSIADEEQGLPVGGSVGDVDPPMERSLLDDEVVAEETLVNSDVDRYAPSAAEEPDSTANEEQADKTEDAPRQQDPPASTEEGVGVIESEQGDNKRPDFLDMCCGDPLELEKYMSGGKGVDKEESQLYRIREVSMREASQKIALLKESSGEDAVTEK